MRRCRCSGRFPHLAKRAPVAATVRLGQLMLQTKRWNEAIRMADLKAQSPSLAITMRFCSGGRHQGDWVFRRDGRAAPFGFLGRRGGDLSPLPNTSPATPAFISLPDRPNYDSVTELSHPSGGGSEMEGIKGCRRDTPISSQRKGNSCSIFLSPRWPNPHFISTES
jgi:hypothetical protein